MLYSRAWRFAEATEVSEHAVALARAAGDPALLAQVLHLRHLATDGVDGYRVNVRLADELLALPEAAPELKVRAVLVRYTAATALGMKPDEGALDRAAAEAERLGSGDLVVEVDLARAGLAAFHGRLDEAERTVDRIAAAASGTGWALSAVRLTSRFDVALQRGRLDALLPDLLSETSLDAMPAFHAVVAAVLAASGRRDEARTRLVRAEPLPRDSTWVTARVATLMAGIELGDVALVERCRDELAPLRGGLVVAGPGAAVLGSATGHLGEALLYLDQPEAARELLLVAVGELERAGSSWWRDRATAALHRC